MFFKFPTIRTRMPIFPFGILCFGCVILFIVDEIFLSSHFRRIYSYRSSDISHIFEMVRANVNIEEIFVFDNISYFGSKLNTCESTNIDDRFPVTIIINAVTYNRSILPLTLQSIENFTDKNSVAKIVICSTKHKFDVFNTLSNKSEFSGLFEWIIMEESLEEMTILEEGVKAASDSGPMAYADDMTIFSEGWLTPLIAIVSTNSSIIAQSSLDIITKSSINQGDASRAARFQGNTDWSLRLSLVNSNLDNSSVSYSSPVLMNHVFMFSKKLYENFIKFYKDNRARPLSKMEFSFYSWMCGHGILISPCSSAGRIADIRQEQDYRQRLQAARFWLGDYRKYFYIANHVPEGDNGYETFSEKEFSNQGCKTFDWFIKEVPSGLKIPPNGTMVFGKMKSQHNFCVGFNSKKSKHLLLVPCNSTDIVSIAVTNNGLLVMEGQCLFAYRTYIYLRNCTEQSLGEWAYTSDETIRWYDNRCITVMIAKKSDPELRLHPCLKKMRDFAMWTFDYSLPLNNK